LIDNSKSIIFYNIFSPLEVRHFKLITAIADAGSLTRAAERLCLTQSALSHQLKEVEGQLKTKLFDRVNKKLVLTPAGNILLKSSRTIIDQIEKTRKEISRHLLGETGEVRLSTECYTCYHWLPFIIKQFQSDFPNIDITIRTGGPPNPVEQVLSGKLDLAVVYTRIEHRSLEYTELFADDLVAVIPAGSVLASKPFLKPTDFADQYLFTSSAHFEESKFFVDFLKVARVRPKRVTYVQLTEALIQMVRAGLGITVLPRWLIKPYLNDPGLLAVKLGKNGLKRKWFVTTLRSETRPPYISSLVRHIKDGVYL
jgi:LysR family transcriptional regulator for metE and metH